MPVGTETKKDDLSGHIIRQLEERHVTIKVDLMVWSNKMDLLALSNSKGEVVLHRLTWQRVWVLPPPSAKVTVRKIAWRPDGRVLAIAYVPKVMRVGYEVKGEVMLVDVENKELLHVIPVKDDVSCLVWLQEKQLQEYNPTISAAAQNLDGTSDFLPKLSSLSRTFGPLLDNFEENLEDAKRIKDQSQLNFLLIGTCDANLYLSVFGLFSCGIMDIKKYMPANDKEKHISVLSSEITSDMKSLFLLVAVDEEKFYAETMKDENAVLKVQKATQTEDVTSLEFLKATENNLNQKQANGDIFENGCDVHTSNSQSTDTGSIRKRELKILILDTRVLSSRSRELHALSLKHGHIISLLDYLSQTMRSIVEAWENIYLLEIESKLSQHAECLPEGSLSADFLELLLIGVPSESLENFLLDELNDKGIKKLGHSIELSHSNIQKLILKNLLTVGQSLAYHLAEMKGMAKLTDRFQVLGLEERTVSEAFSAAGAFLIKSTEVQIVIDESMKRYKAFFRWLYAIILRITDDRIPDLTMNDINQQDLEFIADYLHKLDCKTDKDGVRRRHCYLDRLGQYLVNGDLVSPTVKDKDNHWETLLEQNPCLKSHFNIIERFKHTSLVQQHKILKEAIHNVFKTPEHAIGNMFQLKSIVNIGKIAYTKFSMCIVTDCMILLSLVEANSQNEFQMISILTDGNKHDVKCKSVSYKTAEKVPMKCLDVQFYLPQILSVLLEEQDENRNAVIVQVMTKPIYENSASKIDGSSLTDSVVMHQLQGMVASSFTVSGARKVSVILSESRRKVRLFEMEAEDDDEDEDLVPLELPAGLVQAQKGYYTTVREESMIENGDGSRVTDENEKLQKHSCSTSEMDCT